MESLQVGDALEIDCANEAVEFPTVASAANSSVPAFSVLANMVSGEKAVSWCISTDLVVHVPTSASAILPWSSSAANPPPDSDIGTSEERFDESLPLIVKSQIANGEHAEAGTDGQGDIPDGFVCAFSLEFRENEVGRLDIWIAEHGGERIARSLSIVFPKLKWIVECCPVLAELSWNEEYWVLLIRVGETLDILCHQEEFVSTWDEHLRLMLYIFIDEVEQIVLGEEFWVSKIWSKPESIPHGDER